MTLIDYYDGTMQRLKQRGYDFLRSTEKYTKTDMIYLAKGGFWLFMLQFVSAGASLILSVVLARTIPKETFGTYKYIISIAGLLSAFTLTGLGTAVTQAIANGKDGTLKWAYRTNIKWSFGFVALSIIGAVYYYFNDNTTLSLSLVFIALFIPITNSSSLYSSYYNAKKRFKEFGILGSLRFIIPTISLIVTAFSTNNPLIIVFVYFLSNAIAAYIIYRITIQREHVSSESEHSGTLTYSKHLSSMSVIGIVADNLDKVIIFQLVGSAELAMYTFATAIPTQIKGVLKNVYTLAFPKFAVKENALIKKILPGAILRFTSVTIVIVLTYIVFAPFIFKILFPEYTNAIIYSQVFALSLLFYSSVLVSAGLQSKGMVSALYKINTYNSLVKIILVIGLAYFYGVWGVIFSRVASEAISLASSYYFFSKDTPTT